MPYLEAIVFAARPVIAGRSGFFSLHQINFGSLLICLFVCLYVRNFTPKKIPCKLMMEFPQKLIRPPWKKDKRIPFESFWVHFILISNGKLFYNEIPFQIYKEIRCKMYQIQTWIGSSLVFWAKSENSKVRQTFLSSTSSVPSFSESKETFFHSSFIIIIIISKFASV